ncbi:hypothetical protein ACFL6P_03095 [Candidatus Latescibacterota bacterium]
MDRIDFEAVNQTALLNIDLFLESLLPGGDTVGHEYVVKNPTRVDNRPGSFRINKKTGVWSDFATGDSGGDLISLIKYVKDVSMSEAAREIEKMYGVNTIPKQPIKSYKKRQTWIPILPVPDDAPNPLKNHSKYGQYATSWQYRDETGNVLGYAFRFDKTDEHGKTEKVVLPQTYCHNGNGTRKWQWKSFAPPRPLYVLDRLAKYPDLPVLVVEGEKCAEAANIIIGDHFVATTNMMGSNGVNKANWSPLKGRDIIVWPDNDSAGEKALQSIVTQLKAISRSLMVVSLPDDIPQSWDIADAIEDRWNAEKLLSFIEQRKTIPELSIQESSQGINQQLEQNIDPMTHAPFRCLGYDHEHFYYLSHRGQQVNDFTANQHTSRNLITLAPLQWWAEYFPGDRSPNWQKAADTLINTCYSTGFYDQNRLRGRGAWYDERRVVLHHGDHLIVDGARQELHDFDSNYIYEAGPVTELSSVAPISKQEAHWLLEALEQLAWENSISAKLLAGWCVLAPISGALTWRPHVLITGSSGCGKSTLLERILKPLLGEASIFVLSNTTEAGIRQRLGNDAFPVIFDEAETENQHSQRRMDHVFELIRQSSSSAGGSILKGSQDGKGMSFKIRSCFCLASIGVSLQQRSDQSRISVLGLTRHHPNDVQDYFDELNHVIYRHLTSEWQAGMRARSIKMIPVIRKNISIFSQAVASVFGGNMRAGDQLGTLLAGAYSLSSDSVIDYQEALKWVEEQDWSEQQADDIETDEVRCLNKILQHILIVNQDGRRFERSVVNLLALAGDISDSDKQSWEEDDAEISQNDANATLARNGIRIHHKTKDVLISNSHEGIRKILHDTPWARGWNRFLKRCDGAIEYNGVRFESGTRTRAVSIPIKLIFAEEETGKTADMLTPC